MDDFGERSSTFASVPLKVEPPPGPTLSASRHAARKTTDAPFYFLKVNLTSLCQAVPGQIVFSVVFPCLLST